MNKELAKTLTTALVQFIDRERPEGSMCCSDTECAGIEKMFEGECFDIIETFIQKKLSRLTEFERAFLERVFHQKPEDLDEETKEIFLEDARFVLALAREQFIKDGYIIEKKAFHDAVEKVDPEVMKEVSDNVDKANEEELTEFEQEVSDMVEYCKEHGEYVAFDYAKRHAKTLLALAKKQLQPEIDAEIEKAYKTQDDVVFHKGWEQGRTDALKNLPMWRRDDSIEAEQHITVGKNGNRFHYKGHSLLISDLTKLPGFNED